MKNVVCLISGRGSNLQAIVHAAQAENWAVSIPARIAAVISNRPDAPGLVLAADAGIERACVPSGQFASRESFEAALIRAIDAYRPDGVVLAGFMRVLTAGFVAHYAGRMINIHPSLLPAFSGLATHRRALAAGVRVHGCTVHFVSNEVDAGAIIAQAAVPVFVDDTEESLAQRVLEQEHRLLPRCLRWLLSGQVRLEGGRVIVAPQAGVELAVLAA
jgi:phosphoribosylglycinamide formyltransferase-1